MVVLNVTSCPLQLRGDLSKWLNEISTGVYIGRISARVREELWDRICENIKDGQVVMIYSANNAQGFEIRVHNTPWKPVDYEGITLMRRPLPKQMESDNGQLKRGFSKAARNEKIRRAGRADSLSYVVLDLETTGLDPEKDRILEIGAVEVSAGEIRRTFQRFVKAEEGIPPKITELTGITEEMTEENGVCEETAITELMAFIGEKHLIIGYNIKFDLAFIRQACERNHIKNGIRRTKDVLQLARRKIRNIENYRMYTVASYFSMDAVKSHRALDDCELLNRIYIELNKI